MTRQLTPIVCAFMDVRTRIANDAIGILGEAGWMPPLNYAAATSPARLPETEAVYFEAIGSSATSFVQGREGEPRLIVAAETLALIGTMSKALERSSAVTQREACEAALAMGLAVAKHQLLINGLAVSKGLEAAEKSLSRADKVAAANSAWADEVWRRDGLKKGQAMREKDPYVTSRKIAEAIHGDPAITSPSYEQISDTIPRWERDGDLPRRVTRAK